MTTRILTLQLRYEHDIVLARQRARQICESLGLSVRDQTRVATAVSELARNAYAYAGGGSVEYELDEKAVPQRLLIAVRDDGPGIEDPAAVLDGSYQSRTGMGLGLVGARRLMDHFELTTALGEGTTVSVAKRLPPESAFTPKDASEMAAALARSEPESPYEELQHQNQEMMQALSELRERQEELTRLNDELGDTNRGVIALYAEMEEQADALRRADDLKTRFLSNMSHEFRTPLNSILSLSRMLLDRMDGALNPEQDKQVGYIRQAAEDLSELVNDLLDLAKVEAGKIVIEPGDFDVGEMLSALRGMLRPLLADDRVSLVFEEPDPPIIMHSDEGKISQILRNFISNAIKFTPAGEVRVRAELLDHGRYAALSVADTGIGIAHDEQQRIFEEFAQLKSPLHKSVRGTGLGLPLAKRLTTLLGGTIRLTSEPDRGSVFTAILPVRYDEEAERELYPEIVPRLDPTRRPLLVVEDSPEMVLLYDKYLRGSGFQVVPAYTLKQARDTMKGLRPAAIVLDVLLPGGDSWEFLAEVKGSEETRDIPVLVVSVVDDPERCSLLGADDYASKPLERSWLLRRLRELSPDDDESAVLVVDDDEVARYILRGMLADTKYPVLEAADGLSGLAMIREHRPRIVLLDLVMPGVDGFEVLHEVRSDPAVKDTPVIVVTSKNLTSEELSLLEEAAQMVVGKDERSREETVLHVRDALRRVEKTILAESGK